jgi:hypothetical protein
LEEFFHGGQEGLNPRTLQVQHREHDYQDDFRFDISAQRTLS